MNPKDFSAIILAAGRGTRMKSPLPKVLHPVAGVPMIKKVIDAVKGAGCTEVRIVVGYGENLVRKVVEPLGARCFVQTQQLGTADAVKSADPQSLDGPVLILNGDHPLLVASDLSEIWREFRDSGAAVAVVSAVLKRPGQFGRIVRQGDQLRAIVEAADASRETLQIQEVNTGIYLAKPDVIKKYLPQIQNHNSKQEFYLTDLIGLCQEAGEKVVAIRATTRVAFGVNTQEELAKASRLLFARKRRELMQNGVLMVHPETVYIEEDVSVGAGSVIYPGVYLRGKTSVGSFTVIEPNVYIANSQIAEGVVIKVGTYCEQAVIATKATVGPYAHLRPGTELGAEAHIGNFVELKKTKFGARSKAGHLTYLGDATIGEDVNVGCGTITCNYATDKQKYRTVIGDRVFIGSDTQFVAPIEIGDDAVIGSGSTLTKNVPARALAVARGRQVIKENYVRSPDKPPADEE
jgi:bifunctional UDP-N-acetylglucosamine pyrophosphorylase/glucosamine-1-phosphate N-acetyltransferase